MKRSTIDCLSGVAIGDSRVEITQPDKETLVVELKSNLHAKSLLGDSKRFDKTLQMIDSELGLIADFVAPPKEDFSEVVINAKSNPPMKLPVDEIIETKISETPPWNGDIGPQMENWLSHIFAFLAVNMRPPLMGISNVSGPKGKSQANSQGRWSRVERKPTTNRSDANMCDLSRERPTFEELEPQTKKT